MCKQYVTVFIKHNRKQIKDIISYTRYYIRHSTNMSTKILIEGKTKRKIRENTILNWKSECLCAKKSITAKKKAWNICCKFINHINISLAVKSSLKEPETDQMFKWMKFIKYLRAKMFCFSYLTSFLLYKIILGTRERL